jgi:hypothetical protein
MARAKYGTSKKYTFNQGDKVRFINSNSRDQVEGEGIVDSSKFRYGGKIEVVRIAIINKKGHIEHRGIEVEDVELIS